MNIIKTILSWQPWKIAVTAVSSVAVVSGAATGVGVTIAHNVNEQTTDSAYVSESNQDTPVFAPVESGTEPETEATTQAKTQPVTQAPPSTTTTEPTTQEKITWTYDEKLSREVAQLLSERFPGAVWDESLTSPTRPERFIENNIVLKSNDPLAFIGKAGSNSAAEIVAAWTECDLRATLHYNIQVYRYSNGWVYTVIRYT